MVQFKDHKIIGLESPSYPSLRKKRLSYLGYFYRSLSNHLKKLNEDDSTAFLRHLLECIICPFFILSSHSHSVGYSAFSPIVL